MEEGAGVFCDPKVDGSQAVGYFTGGAGGPSGASLEAIIFSPDIIGCSFFQTYDIYKEQRKHIPYPVIPEKYRHDHRYTSSKPGAFTPLKDNLEMKKKHRVDDEPQESICNTDKEESCSGESSHNSAEALRNENTIDEEAHVDDELDEPAREISPDLAMIEDKIIMVEQVSEMSCEHYLEQKRKRQELGNRLAKRVQYLLQLVNGIIQRNQSSCLQLLQEQVVFKDLEEAYDQLTQVAAGAPDLVSKVHLRAVKEAILLLHPVLEFANDFHTGPKEEAAFKKEMEGDSPCPTKHAFQFFASDTYKFWSFSSFTKSCFITGALA
ncbi:unnamed protein product [Darwinula stevensoni]|uniref:Uncharacterized protein n=1 Tax=Darwinula stevensoni TaxID=69355 RepID=A0A7R8X6F6_9CRUS|nr:unnamed protein product [Darwinula stevensoni]CAG0882055.1 unnamed protein product [Darwinula stevensoni]